MSEQEQHLPHQSTGFREEGKAVPLQASGAPSSMPPMSVLHTDTGYTHAGALLHSGHTYIHLRTLADANADADASSKPLHFAHIQCRNAMTHISNIRKPQALSQIPIHYKLTTPLKPQRQQIMQNLPNRCTKENI